jgi:hypothetical protein
MSNVIPISLIAIGGLMAVGGGFWLALNNAKSELQIKQVNAKLLDTAQDAAARMGNDKTRDELIQARARLLAGNSGTSDNPVRDIIARLPVLADEYNKLSQDRAHTVDAMATDFKLCWGPLIYFTLSEFDRRLDQVKNELGTEKDSLKITREDRFDFTKIEGTRDNDPLHPNARTISMGTVQLLIVYSRAVITPEGGMRDAVLAFAIRGKGGAREDPFSLTMGLTAGSTGPGERFPKPKDGIPPQEVTTKITAGIVTSLERFLVVERAERSK